MYACVAPPPCRLGMLLTATWYKKFSPSPQKSGEVEWIFFLLRERPLKYFVRHPHCRLTCCYAPLEF
jgi:hypothetical protein